MPRVEGAAQLFSNALPPLELDKPNRQSFDALLAGAEGDPAGEKQVASTGTGLYYQSGLLPMIKDLGRQASGLLALAGVGDLRATLGAIAQGIFDGLGELPPGDVLAGLGARLEAAADQVRELAAAAEPGNGQRLLLGLAAAGRDFSDYLATHVDGSPEEILASVDLKDLLRGSLSNLTARFAAPIGAEGAAE